MLITSVTNKGAAPSLQVVGWPGRHPLVFETGGRDLAHISPPSQSSRALILSSTTPCLLADTVTSMLWANLDHASYEAVAHFAVK
jgi:hypothetical protein